MLPDHRLRCRRGETGPSTGPAPTRPANRSRRRSPRPTGSNSPAIRPALPRPTSSSLPFPPRSTRPIVRISGRWSAPAAPSAAHLKRGQIVCYESTVYPGATEEVCVPILESRFGPALAQRLPCRLLARAHQPRRQGTYADEDRQGRGRRRRGHAATSWPKSMAGSFRPASTRPRRSRSPRPPRSSRTRSATSTSR